MFERNKAITVTGAVLVLWFALNLIINRLEVFGPTAPDLYVYLAILIPVALWVAGYVGVAWFRQYLLSLDLRLLTIIQSCYSMRHQASSAGLQWWSGPGRT